jgi:hypothetical protein
VKPALTVLTTLLRNKWFWIALAVLVAILLAHKYWGEITGFFKPDRTDYTDEPKLTDADKSRLDTLAADLYAEIDGINIIGMPRPRYDEACGLADRELKYLATVYPHYSAGESLKVAVTDEGIIGDTDNKLIARLNNMAE